MDRDKDFFLRFPVVLADKLIKGEICFPEDTYFEYEEITVYRVIEREEDDYTPVTRNDFKSYFELHKLPRAPRGMGVPYEKCVSDPCFYGASSFTDIRQAEQKKLFPKPGKKIACGKVYMEGGPQETNEKNKHVCWWLFKDIEVTGFFIMEDING